VRPHNTATRLFNLFVRNVSAVSRPANRRKFLVIKSEGTDMSGMKQKTAAFAFSKADLDRLRVAATNALRPTTLAESAADEVEARVTERINRNPVTVTRNVALHEVFSADPALYERYRRETTIGRNGQPMSHNPAVRDVGVGKSAADEVAVQVNAIIAKHESLTVAEAATLVFQLEPTLYDRWRAER